MTSHYNTEQSIKLKEGMERLKEQYKRNNELGVTSKPKTVKPVIEPIYDRVYYEGMREIFLEPIPYPTETYYRDIDHSLYEYFLCVHDFDVRKLLDNFTNVRLKDVSKIYDHHTKTTQYFCGSELILSEIDNNLSFIEHWRSRYDKDSPYNLEEVTP